MRIIAGQYGGRRIQTAEGPGYRPATGKVRESVFSMLESLGVNWPEINVADIFAGSGSLAIEALSRGAASAVFVEKATRAASLIRANLQALGIPPGQWTLVRGDALRWLSTARADAFGLVFIDPPYGQNLFLPALRLLMQRHVLVKGGLLCAEVEAGLVLDTDMPELSLLRDKLYGQTRICIWARNTGPSIQAPLIPLPMDI